MAYIGVQPTAGQYRKLDDISGSFNGATTTFTTSVAGENVTAATPQQLLVSVGGVIQQPITDYTTSTNSIIFSTAPASGLDFFAVLMGDAVNIGTPSDGSVTTAKLGADLTVDLASGTAAAPSLTFDSNTGLFSPGADEVAISTGGTTRTTVDSSGRLLVGTSTGTSTFFGVTPQLQLEGVNENGSSLSIFNNQNASTGAYISIGKSRGSATGSSTIVNSGDTIGAIYWVGADGTDRNTPAAQISCQVDGTPGANDMPGRLVFSTTADGASSPTERMKINSTGALSVKGVYDITTANAANVAVLSAGQLYRSTSSSKYKTDIETLQDEYADALLNCRPVWYRSTCESDCPQHSWWGFIAEEVAEIDPRLVQWKTTEVTYDENGSSVETPCDPEPEGVAYDRFVPHLLNLIKRQREQIGTLEAQNASFEARLSALESA